MLFDIAQRYGRDEAREREADSLLTLAGYDIGHTNGHTDTVPLSAVGPDDRDSAISLYDIARYESATVCGLCGGEHSHHDRESVATMMEQMPLSGARHIRHRLRWNAWGYTVNGRTRHAPTIARGTWITMGTREIAGLLALTERLAGKPGLLAARYARLFGFTRAITPADKRGTKRADTAARVRAHRLRAKMAASVPATIIPPGHANDGMTFVPSARLAAALVVQGAAWTDRVDA